MILRILESQWEPFVSNLCARRDVETAGFILAERLYGDEVLIARRLIIVPAGGYQIRRIDQLRVDPLTINRIVREARDGALSIITAHTHPGTDRPWFSAADDNGDSRLMPSFFAQMAGPHGSVVVAGDSRLPTARIWSESAGPQEMDVRIIGSSLRIASLVRLPQSEPDFDRQRLALGGAGQAVLNNLHVAVVGLGGTGSVVFAQLAHLGLRRITVIDGDHVDRSNISRILGARSHDAGIQWKVDVARRYADELGLGTQVRAIRDHLGPNTPMKEIETADVILSCVDKHLPRALLNRLAYKRAIPVIDMGSAFRVNDQGIVTEAAGRVVMIGPNRRCLACWGHIDPQRLRVESLSPDERAKEAAEGYISGADVPQPSVVAFNTMIAGAAVVEFLRLVTGFAGAEDPPVRLSFDFETGTVRRNQLGEVGPCSICEPTARESATSLKDGHQLAS